MWQDWFLAFGNLAFFIFLLPTIFGKNKPEKVTCFFTMALLWVFSYTFYTLHLFLSSLGAGLDALGWSILAWQTLRKHDAIQFPS